ELVELLLPAADVRHVERGAGEAALPGQADDGEGLVPGPGAEAVGRRLRLDVHRLGGRGRRAGGGGGRGGGQRVQSGDAPAGIGGGFESQLAYHTEPRTRRGNSRKEEAFRLTVPPLPWPCKPEGRSRLIDEENLPARCTTSPMASASRMVLGSLSLPESN